MQAILLAATAAAAAKTETATAAKTETAPAADGKPQTYPVTSDAGTACSSRNQAPCSAKVTYSIVKYKTSTKYTFKADFRTGFLSLNTFKQLRPLRMSLRINPKLAWHPSLILNSYTSPKGKVVARNSNGGPQYVWNWTSGTKVQSASIRVAHSLANGRALHLSDVAQQGVVYNGALYDHIPNTGPKKQAFNSALVFVNFGGKIVKTTYSNVRFSDLKCFKIGGSGQRSCSK